MHKESSKYFTKYSTEGFNGTAVGIAKEMGTNVKLMPTGHYRNILQEKAAFDTETHSWLDTHEDSRRLKRAMTGYRIGNEVEIWGRTEYLGSDIKGCRVMLRVKKAKVQSLTRSSE